MAIAAFTAPMNALEFGSLKATDIAFVAAVGVLFLKIFPLLPARSLPRPIAIGGLGIIATAVLHVSAASLNLLPGLSARAEVVAAIEWLAAAVAVPAAIALVCASRSQVMTVMNAWVGGTFLSALTALSDRLELTDVSGSLDAAFGGGTREAGLAVHPNHLGLSCAMALPMGVRLATRHRGLWVVPLVLLGGVLLSGSRAAQLTTVLVLILLLGPVFQRWAPRRAAVGMIFGLMVLAALAARFLDVAPLLRVVSQNSTLESNRIRRGIARDALDIISEYPGTGVGLQAIEASHSIYLQLAASGGILLVVTFGYYLFRPLSDGSWFVRRSFDPERYVIGVTHLAWLVTGVVSNILTDRFLYYPIAALWALASLPPRASIGASAAPPAERRETLPQVRWSTE